ncbi:MAG: YqgE/AlgH family protein [Magnetospirillum sp. WYHS-4]
MRMLAFLLAWLALAPPVGAEETEAPLKQTRFLGGQFLIAGPGMRDPRFRETVIYMVSHDRQGALGLVVNQVLGKGPLKDLLADAGIAAPEDMEGEIDLHIGGPVETRRVFILHKGDWRGPATESLAGGMSMTTTPDILEALAKREGPKEFVVIAGYSGWGPGQLEKEMARGDWITAPSDIGLVFDRDQAGKWQRASKRGGLAL